MTLDRAEDLGGTERGSEALQFAAVAAVILALIFGTIQVGLFYYARSIASGAADKALQAARTEHGSTSSGTAAGASFLRAAGPRALTGATVSVDRGAQTTTATVSGQMISVVPLIQFPPISAHAQGPTERVTG